VRAAAQSGKASSRVDELGAAWDRLVSARDEASAASFHADLNAFRTAARERSLGDVERVCTKLEDIAYLAHRRQYDVPTEVLLTASMAIEFLAHLESTTDPAAAARIDVAGFLSQLDCLLGDARGAEPAEEVARTSVRPRAPSQRPPTLDEGDDYLGRSTRERLALIATELYLESRRAAGPMALRLRDTWRALDAEVAALGQVNLKTWMSPHLPHVGTLAQERGKVARVVADIEDTIVAPEVATLLETCALPLLANAVIHGIETPYARTRAGKTPDGLVRVDVRVSGENAVLLVEDDGAGVDIEAITRAAIELAIVPPGTVPDEQQAQSLMFHRGVTTVGRPTSAGLGLDVVRAAVRAANGSIQTRTFHGRGTSVRIVIPHVPQTTEVRTFRGANEELLFAVDTRWTIADVDASGRTLKTIDPRATLALPGERNDVQLRSMRFTRGDTSYVVEVRSAPQRTIVRRTCPTAPEIGAEVVRVGEAEAILVRLDVLARTKTALTAPPPALEDMEIVVRTVAPPASEPLAQKVLVVDDRTAWVTTTRTALAHRGFEVEVREAIVDIFESLDRWAPDLVLMGSADSESGKRLRERFENERPLLPVLVLTEGQRKDLASDVLAEEIRRRCGTHDPV
jgi:signal transduction histidine kinase/CheY-like chemotaxis protein